MRHVALVLFLICLAAPASADQIEVRQVAQPKFHQSVSLETIAHGNQVVDPNARPIHVGVAANKVAVTLNCENDNIINLANTLVLGPDELAGNFFDAPVTPSPYHIREVIVGLVDFGQLYPAELLIEFYEDDGAGTYNFTTAIIANIPSSPGGGTIYTIDVSAFNIIMTNDVLTLMGDNFPSEGGHMLIAGDNSPRCLDTDPPVCSVVAVPLNPNLFIYGVNDVSCPNNGILMFDLVHELVVDEVPVSTFSASVGAVKSKYEE